MTKFLLLCFLAVAAQAQQPDDIWQRVDQIPARPASEAWIHPQKFKAFNLNRGALQSVLARAGQELPREKRAPDTELVLPMPDGTMARFKIIESPIMEPALAAKYPQIKTYRGVGVDDPQASLRLDLTPQGFHAQILSPRGAVYIDPYWKGDDKLHTSYYKHDYRRAVNDWTCLTRGSDAPAPLAVAAAGEIGIESSGGTLRTYRLACAATIEYTTFHGGTKALGLAAVVTAINRVTGVYEVEFAIRLVLVANDDQLIFVSGNDGYSNSNGSTMLGQNQTKCDTIIGDANYDIGHVFSTGGGGVAYLGVVCESGSKAGGVTGNSSPTGDSFWIDYVAHEMGHQFGADHTFNSTTGSCGGGNRSASAAFEPGSGSTIMAYAGICGSDDLQPHSDPYFHSISYEQVMTYVASGGNCSVNSSTGNTAPGAPSNGGNFTIPASTPFTLTASGSDPNGDALTFCWEERDLGAALTVSAADNGASPIFRSFNPASSPSRTFPKIEDLIGNTNSVGEKLPTTSRTMKFRVTVRDNRTGGGGVNSSATNGVTVVSTAGPFVITFPNTATNLAGAVTVTWDAANTASAPINAANVDILLSTDGGLTFPTVLLAGTPNDGSQAVTLPNVTTSTARIEVRASNNIFFDISNANFSIVPDIPFPSVVTDSATLTSEGCAAANSAIDPGETVTFSFALKNTGTANASNVVATLQTTGGVTAPSGSQSYGTLLAGGAAVARSFSFTANGSCGGSLTATLALQTNSLSLGSVNFNFALGTLGALSTNDYSSGGLATAIPDVSTIEIPISITETGIISDVNVRVRLNHTFDADLDIALVAPDNTVIELSSDNGGSGNNYGSGASSCSGTFTVFDDAAATSVTNGSAPFANTYKPEQPLSALNGKSITGIWKLRIIDDTASDTGTLYCWQLQIAHRQPVCCSGIANQPPAITAASISPASPDTTQNLIVSVTSSNDPDGDPVTLDYQWQESATNLTGQTAGTLPAAITFAGGSYQCVVTPNDGKVDGTPFTTAPVLVALDSDADGLNDDWEISNFGSLGAQTGSGDFDGDGFTNLQEQDAGTDPSDAASAPAITSVAPSGADVLVSFTTVTGKLYRVERSDDFAGWTTVTNNVAGTGGIVTATDPGGATQPNRFYRVDVLP